MKSWINYLLRTFLGILFFTTIIIIVNLFSIKHYYRQDFTALKIYQVTGDAKKVLKEFNNKLSVYVYLPRTAETQEVYRMIEDILNEFKQHCSYMQIEYIEPFGQDLKSGKIIRNRFKIPKNSSGEIIFEYEKRFKKIAVSNIAEFDRYPDGRVARLKKFTGHNAFVNAMMSILHARSGKIYFTVGHRELSIKDREKEGLNGLRSELEFQNYKCEEISLPGKDLIPTDCLLLVIAGPRLTFTTQELLLIDKYLNTGGRILCLLDPVIDSEKWVMRKLGIEELLQEYGIRPGNDILVDLKNNLSAQDPSHFLIRKFNIHEITELFAENKVPLVIALARSINLSTAKNKKHRAKCLLFTSSFGWAESKIGSLKRGTLEKEMEDTPGPVPCMAVLQAEVNRENSNGSVKKYFKIAAIGDSDLINNAHLANVGNRDFSLSVIHWLLDEKDFISLGYKDIKSLNLLIPMQDLWFIRFYINIILPAISLLAGILIYYWRNR
ncbi:GldG family protein [Candidatus Riflebacteria bacterium]